MPRPDLLAARSRRTCLFSAVWRNASPGWPDKSQAESKDKRYSFMILLHSQENHGKSHEILSGTVGDMKVLVTSATSPDWAATQWNICATKGISVRATGRNEAMGKLLRQNGGGIHPGRFNRLVSRGLR